MGKSWNDKKLVVCPKFFKEMFQIDSDTPCCCLLVCFAHLMMIFVYIKITHTMMYAPSCYPIIFSNISVAESYNILQHLQNFYSENTTHFKRSKKCRIVISLTWHFIKSFAPLWMNLEEAISAGIKSARKILPNLTH